MPETYPTPTTPADNAGHGADRPARRRLPPTKVMQLPKLPKPEKPVRGTPDYPADSPLFPHATGRWAKKIRGQLHYFGYWSGPDGPNHDAALRSYNEQADALHSGRSPKTEPDGELNVKGLCNEFLNAKQAALDSNEIVPKTFGELKATADLLVKRFGKRRLVADLTPADFASLRQHMAKRWGPVRLFNAISRVRCIFKFGYDNGLLAVPVRFGTGFDRPSRKTLRLERARRGPKMFTADEVRRILAAAKPQHKAMILLAVNGGLGNSDLGQLPLDALDLEGGWLNYPRPKTGIGRRIPLWRETVQAIKDYLPHRPTPKTPEAEKLAFVTLYGNPWYKRAAGMGNPLSDVFRRLLDSLGINGNRCFYALRHVFETVGGGAKDQVAVNAIMGHADSTMSAVYREHVEDARLVAVVEHVRTWLFGAPAAPAAAP
jgi:integrase